MSIIQLSDAKQHARITIDDDDALVQGMIDAAEAHVGNYLGAALTTFLWGPALTAGSFVVETVYTIQSVGTTDFTAIGASANTVGLTFTATGAGTGTGTATPQAPLPDPLAEAVKQLVGFLYDNREAAVVGNTITVTPMSPGFYDLLAPYKMWIF